MIWYYLFFGFWVIKGVFQGYFLIQILPHIFITIGVVNLFFHRHQRVYFPKRLFDLELIILLLFVAVLATSFFKANVEFSITSALSDVFAILNLFFFVYLKLSKEVFYENIGEQFYRFILKPLVLIQILIIILFIVGYANGDFTTYQNVESVLFSYFGITVNRVLFPYTNMHPNVIGIIGGASFVLSATLILVGDNLKVKRKWLLCISILSMAIMIIADSRATLFFSLSTIFIFLVLRSLSLIKLYKLLPALYLIIPFVFVLTLKLISSLPISEEISRGKNDLENGNSRLFIWHYCLEEIKNPKVQHFFGYGTNGEKGAGINKKYSKYFSINYFSDDSIVTHNAMLQILFDMGYLGVIVYLLSIKLVIDSVLHLSLINKCVLATLSFFLFLMQTGITESNVGPYYKVLLFIIIVNLSFIFVLHSTLRRNNYRKEKCQIAI